MTARLRILACGAIDRGDDGAALWAVRALPPSDRLAVEIAEVGQLSADLLMDDPPETQRVVVDCVVGLPVGAIVDLPLSDLPDLEEQVGTTSSHAVSSGSAVGVAALVGAVRATDRFIGIGGVRFDLGAEMSPAVVEGLDRLVARLTDHIEEARTCV